jgi:hypothetical protein
VLPTPSFVMTEKAAKQIVDLFNPPKKQPRRPHHH